MIAWTPKFPRLARPIGYLRLLRARRRYWDTLALGFSGGLPRLVLRGGYQTGLAALRDRHKGRRCFVISNGPGLKDLDVSRLRDEVTIGCNGVYKAFEEWGFHSNFLLFEDIEQLELRRADIGGIRGPLKLAALYNAYAFPADGQTMFFNAPRMQGHDYYWSTIYPQFSKDFASIVHLGSTVTYIMLQLAYHLGCDPVYVIGLDHDYGLLPKLFPPGKITITAENSHLVRGLHFSDRYYEVGDQIGVPFVERQEMAYAAARQAFESAGRRLINASTRTKLDTFERIEFAGLFDRGSAASSHSASAAPQATMRPIAPAIAAVGPDRIADLLFSPAPVDEAWLAQFVESSADPSWLDGCAAVVERRYAENREARDGFSRVGWALARMGRQEEARGFFERDRVVGRMRRWQFVRYVETLVALGAEKSAEEVIAAYYAAHPEARDGRSPLAEYAWRGGRREQARDLYRREFLEGRLSSSLVCRLACFEAGLGDLAAAEKIVAGLYASDPVARDGYLRLATGAWQEGSSADAMRFIGMDAGVGRLSRAGRDEAIRMVRESCVSRGYVGRLAGGLARWLTDEGLGSLALALASGESIRDGPCELVRRIALRGGKLALDGATLAFADEHSLHILLGEILVFENYWFPPGSAAPTIIDAGANFGLATYYFRSLFPDATILAFEPDPAMAALLRRNVDANGWSNVRVLTAALARQSGRATFHATPGHSMAGSLTSRMVDKGVAHREFDVECRRLSEYLTGPVDFVKLDIEGAEREVIEEAGSLLSNVSHLFCEYHRLPGVGLDDLAAILSVVERAGFEVELAGPSRLEQAGHRGMENVRGRSLQLWATRRTSSG